MTDETDWQFWAELMADSDPLLGYTYMPISTECPLGNGWRCYNLPHPLSPYLSDFPS